MSRPRKPSALEEAARAAFRAGFAAARDSAIDEERSFGQWWKKVRPRTCSSSGIPQCMGEAARGMCTCTGRLRLERDQ